ncbi:TetR/AcrR family transcriptional regulator [Streptomyces sp. SID13031]|uniref:TetR/AcrR family transcriptional regulator n=1 Tax=Streptomyces sp. SID13031 TaxID=2706046 RepID=UPI0013C8E354|nr:TetR/AcrR family transcriptional regulator [Streptomyces sp. SID13031]NEA32845.1 TetR/AcrR family transcriptional regulator [Streptomyces sp. SID13031]
METPAGQPPLRRDAELNRQRLLAAAHEVFRDRGLSATLEDVARHAGVGIGTAYRRFANRDALIDALFEDMIAKVAAMAVEAAEDPDAWRGLSTSLERVCELQTFDRGLRDIMLGTGRGRRRQELVAERIKPTVDAMIQRAKDQGVLRTDVEGWDLPMIQLMVATITDHTGHPDLWRRYLHLMLDGMRIGGADGTTLPVALFPDGQPPSETLSLPQG